MTGKELAQAILNNHGGKDPTAFHNGVMAMLIEETAEPVGFEAKPKTEKKRSLLRKVKSD